MAGDQQQQERTQTQVGDLPETCLAHAIALTSPRDACRCAAVSPVFRASADSDHVWRRFLPLGHRGASVSVPPQPQGQQPPKPAAAKDAYLRLCDAGAAVPVDGEGSRTQRLWLDRASGARCYMLSARALSLPWDDGELSWRWTPHPLSRFGDAAELVGCTSLDIYARLPAAELTPATTYAAYLVYGVAEGHRGLSYPDQETTVALAGARVAPARHAVCLHRDEAEARKFRAVSRGTGGEEPRLREDGWSEMEMGRLRTPGDGGREAAGEEVVVSFEVLGWYPKRGLILEGIEFRPVN
ncbi:putative F-box protein PP2-B8 [Panicum miliaceum]|uniref:F-box protein PP2-B8 n=1 Tax=Panicum miliaceum TaxID=4540 RepID=A0A3L6TUE6_PANMI|nr:putative F-box protein PP2-B8 [Panicum miliaceum]